MAFAAKVLGSCSVPFLMQSNKMPDRDKTIDALKHLVRYYQQAVHEFFDEAGSEVEERAQAVFNCLEKDANSLPEYQKMVELLANSQADLGKRAEDLRFLVERMNKLF
jgi:hypothetical protein